MSQPIKLPPWALLPKLTPGVSVAYWASMIRRTLKGLLEQHVLMDQRVASLLVRINELERLAHSAGLEVLPSPMTNDPCSRGEPR